LSQILRIFPSGQERFVSPSRSRTTIGYANAPRIGESQVYRKECFGVLDHYVAPPPEMEVYVPMRVQPNGSGNEVILFWLPGMTGEQFVEGVGMVERI
jgi:hypothetical protein